MREFNLRAASTFCDNNWKYNTWIGLPNLTTRKRQAYQIDHIFIPKDQLYNTMNVKRRFDGTYSDHAVLLLKFHLLTNPLMKKRNPIKITQLTKKVNNILLKKQALSSFQEKNANFLTIFQM
jgi:hypothetical protein